MTQTRDRSMISSKDIEGAAVYGPDAKKIGEIEHLIIEKVSGQVRFAVISFGGLLGMGSGHYPVPWPALTYDTSIPGYRAGITETQLRDAPAFAPGAWEDHEWREHVYQYYNVPGF